MHMIVVQKINYSLQSHNVSHIEAYPWFDNPNVGAFLWCLEQLPCNNEDVSSWNILLTEMKWSFEMISICKLNLKNTLRGHWIKQKCFLFSGCCFEVHSKDWAQWERIEKSASGDWDYETCASWKYHWNVGQLWDRERGKVGLMMSIISKMSMPESRDNSGFRLWNIFHTNTCISAVSLKNIQRDQTFHHFH